MSSKYVFFGGLFNMFPSDSILETEVTFGKPSQPASEDSPFHILFLGDWSGGHSAKFDDISTTQPIVVDRDNFDEVMSKLNVRLSLDINGNGRNHLSLRFNELDDFHPDNIFLRTPLFTELRDLRKRLLNEKSFNEAAREIRSWFPVEEQNSFPETSTTSSFEEGISNSQNLLDDILNSSTTGKIDNTSQNSQSSELETLLSNIVSPFIIRTDENEQAELIKVIDDATSDLMRSILHHPKFQELESAWRGLYLLVRNVETALDLKIFLFDISKDTFVSKLKNIKELSDSEVYRLLVDETEQTLGGVSWALICANYIFEINIDDIAALIRIAKISETASSPFISQVSPESFGLSDSFSQVLSPSDLNISKDSEQIKLWTLLRSLPESKFLGLSMPGFLARLPYGSATEPTETFSFEEFTENFEHTNYLWSNPTFLCALLLAQTFRKYGWNFRGKFQLGISDLPTHIFQDKGYTVTKPCAEFLISETALQKLLKEGIIPLISFKNTDRIQIGGFPSVSSSSESNFLSGKWI